MILDDHRDLVYKISMIIRTQIEVTNMKLLTKKTARESVKWLLRYKPLIIVSGRVGSGRSY